MDRMARRYFEFDGFRLHPAERLLEHDGKILALTPKVFDLLVVLVEQNRHTVSRDELIDRIWADTIVEENSLTRNISILRRALGVSGQYGAYIKTVPKTGYRFEADVRSVIEAEEEIVLERRTNYNFTVRRETQNGGALFQRTRALSIGSLLGLLSLIGLVAGWSYWNEFGTANSASSEQRAKALDLFHRGRELWQDRSAASLHKATLLFEQAVEHDPELAVAHAALADAYAFDTRNWRNAEDAARRAIELDPGIGEPYASIGFVRLFWQWDFSDAERYFKNSISLSPDYATAHQWYALMLASVGHFSAGLAEMQSALDLEPDSPAINADMCQMFYFIRRYDAAEAQCKRALEIDPNSFNVHRHLYFVHLAQGREREAVEAFIAAERLAVNYSTLPTHLEGLELAFERGGIEEFWREQIRFHGRTGDECGMAVAALYAQLGNRDEAAVCLQNAARRRQFGFIFIFADPLFRELGDHQLYYDMADRLIKSQLTLAESS
jgi:DNA-binding winged helix-turn-helix (wHTH) protein/Tfp pilus assembly protein PilF